MEDVNRRLKQINNENIVWIIYLFLIGLCFYSNYYEKKYFCTNDINAKNRYRNITIFIFIVAVLVYIYFFIDNYKDYKDLENGTRKKTLNGLSLFASGLILISGLIFLYLSFIDKDLDVELAFS